MLENLKSANLRRFNAMHVTLEFTTIAKHLIEAKDRYQTVEKKTGVPWPIIAVIHMRESSQDFHTQLAQGDPLASVSTHVPRGQGPYLGVDAWERAAGRALIETGGSTWKDWSPGGFTTFLEKFNGLGYYAKENPSPYVWAGTDQYHSGKYIADGVYSSSAVDTQPGCVAMLHAMSLQDSTIDLKNLNTTTVATPIVAKVPAVLTKDITMLSWKTTISGIMAIIASIAGLFTMGKFDLSMLSTSLPGILAGLGLIFAKDSTAHSTPAEVAHAGVVADLAPTK